MKELTRILEALLFVADGPLSREQIQEALGEWGTDEIAEAVDELRETYAAENRGIGLYSVGDGHQVLTRPEMSSWVERFLAGRRKQRLSRAALEVLSIVAYRQPITRGEVETIRGVDCGATLHTLLERRLVTIKGRAHTVGHPLLYITTPVFLEHFGLEGLKDLPRLEEFAALIDRDAARQELREAGLIVEPAPEPAPPDGDGGDPGTDTEPGDSAKPEAFLQPVDIAEGNGGNGGGEDAAEAPARATPETAGEERAEENPDQDGGWASPRSSEVPRSEEPAVPVGDTGETAPAWGASPGGSLN